MSGAWSGWARGGGGGCGDGGGGSGAGVGVGGWCGGGAGGGIGRGGGKGVGSLTQYMPRGNKQNGCRIARIVFDAGARFFCGLTSRAKRQSRNDANASATAPVGVFFGL